MEEPRRDPRHELASAAGLFVLGLVLILFLGPPRFPGFGMLGSSAVFLFCLAVVPLVALALDRLTGKS